MSCHAGAFPVKRKGSFYRIANKKCLYIKKTEFAIGRQKHVIGIEEHSGGVKHINTEAPVYGVYSLD